jgi:hypothetical protein
MANDVRLAPTKVCLEGLICAMSLGPRPNASRLLSCDYWNRKDILPERKLSKDDYQDVHNVNWNKVLKEKIPDVLVVQQPRLVGTAKDAPVFSDKGLMLPELRALV